MRSVKGDIYFNCKFCKTDYLGGISAVRKHGKREKHLAVVHSRKSTLKINTMPSIQNSSIKTKEAEIRLSMFIVEHNIATHCITLFLY